MKFLKNIIDWVFGYDIFVSYAWNDEKNGIYAEKLVSDLRSIGRYKTCFDQTDYHVGMELPYATRRRVRSSTVLILVLRKFSAESNWVLLELSEAIKSSRTIIVIDINNTFETISNNSPLFGLIKDRLHIREYFDGKDNNIPSSKTLADIQRSFTFLRKDKLKLLVAISLAVVFAAISMFAFNEMLLAIDQTKLAISRQKASEAQVEFTNILHLNKALSISIDAANMGLQNDADNPALFLSAAITPKRVFDNHYQSSVWDVSYCGNNDELVIADSEGIIKLLNTRNGKEKKIISVGEEPIKQVFCTEHIIFSKDYSFVSAIDKESGAVLWRLPSTQASIAISENTSQIAIINPKNLLIVDINTGKSTLSIKSENDIGPNSRVSISHDGAKIAFTKTPSNVVVYKVNSNNAIKLGEIELGENIWGISFDPSDTYLGIVALSESNIDTRMIVRVYDSKNLANQLWDSTHRIFKTDPEYYPKQIISFNKAGQVLIGSVDGSVRVMDSRTGEEIRRVGHNISFSVNDLMWLPDEQYFASSNFNNTASIWEYLTGKEIARIIHNGSVEALAVSPDGDQIATASWDKSVRLSETHGAEPLPLTVNAGETEKIAFDPSSNYLVTTGKNVRLWKNYGNKVTELPNYGKNWKKIVFGVNQYLTAGIDNDKNIYICKSPDCIINLHQSAVFMKGAKDVFFSDTGNVLGIQTESGIQLFDHKLSKIYFESGNPNEVIISPNGKYIAKIYEKQVIFTKINDNQFTSTIDFTGRATVCFSNSESWAAVASTEQDLRIIDFSSETPNVLKNLAGQNIVACNPKGKYIATQEKHSNNIIMLDPLDEVFKTILPHNERVYNLSFDNSGNYIATSGVDNLVRVWDLKGEEVSRRPAKDVVYLAFSADSEYLASSSEGLIQFHMWKPTSLLREAEIRADSKVK